MTTRRFPALCAAIAATATLLLLYFTCRASPGSNLPTSRSVGTAKIAVRIPAVSTTDIVDDAVEVTRETAPSPQPHRLVPADPDDHPPLCPRESSPYAPCGPDRYCSPLFPDDDKEEEACLHKSLLGNVPSWRDALCLFLAVACCAVAATAGIGGGGLMLPLIAMVTNFTPKEAAVLSDAAVFGNCLGQMAVNVAASYSPSPRSDGGGPVASEGPRRGVGEESASAAVMTVLPGLLAGGALAVALDGLVPSTAVLILALLTLVFASVKTGKKVAALRRAEADGRRGAGEEEDEEGDGVIEDEVNDAISSDEPAHRPSLGAQGSYSSPGRIDDEEEGGLDGRGDVDEGARSQVSGPELSSSRACDCWGGLRGTPIFSLYKIEILILLCWALDAATFLALRGSGGHEVAPKCSVQYFVLACLPTVFAGVFLMHGRAELRKKRQGLTQLCDGDREGDNIDLAAEPLLGGMTLGGESREENDLSVTPPQDQDGIPQLSRYKAEGDRDSFDPLSPLLPPYSFSVGLLSALLGIGGGELVGPLLLSLGMDPRLSTSATAVISFLNSGTNGLHFLASGAVVSPLYGLVLGVAGICGGAGGRTAATKLSGRGGGKGRGSIFATGLLVVLIAAALLVAYELCTRPPDWEIPGLC